MEAKKLVVLLVACLACAQGRPLGHRLLAEDTDSTANSTLASLNPAITRLYIKVGDSLLWTLPPKSTNNSEFVSVVEVKNAIEAFRMQGESGSSGEGTPGEGGSVAAANLGTPSALPDQGATLLDPVTLKTTTQDALLSNFDFNKPGEGGSSSTANGLPAVTQLVDPNAAAAVVAVATETAGAGPANPVPTPVAPGTVPAPVTPPPSPTPLPEFAGGCPDAKAALDQMNAVRAVHRAAPLAWNNDLANHAQSWANTCAMNHSPSPAGENLMMGMQPGTLSGCLESVLGWAAEAPLYDYSGNFIHAAGHFTQLIWAGSSQVGCGFQVCPSGNFAVCYYNAPGNVIGQFNDFVFPPGK